MDRFASGSLHSPRSRSPVIGMLGSVAADAAAALALRESHPELRSHTDLPGRHST